MLPEVDVIASKRGVPVEEHIRVTTLIGQGLTTQEKELLKKEYAMTEGAALNIVVGQRGGDSVEVYGGQSTSKTAVELGLSVEDNAGTGGGGGSYVYTSNKVLLLAAAGEGGARCI